MRDSRPHRSVDQASAFIPTTDARTFIAGRHYARRSEIDARFDDIVAFSFTSTLDTPDHKHLERQEC